MLKLNIKEFNLDKLTEYDEVIKQKVCVYEGNVVLANDTHIS